MTKELRTADQLSDLIVSSLGVREIEIQIRQDHAYGWQPTVVSSPGDIIGYQRRVEEIANRLRFQFTLRGWHPECRAARSALTPQPDLPCPRHGRQFWALHQAMAVVAPSALEGSVVEASFPLADRAERCLLRRPKSTPPWDAQTSVF